MGIRVVEEGSKYRVIGVFDVARLLEERNALEDVMLRDIETTPIMSTSEESSIHDRLYPMVRHRVRHAYVDEQGKIITDRDVVRYLLSSATVDDLREDPGSTLARPVRGMRSHMRQPAVLEAETSIADPLKQLLNNEAYTVIANDKQRIIAPWDMTGRERVQEFGDRP